MNEKGLILQRRDTEDRRRQTITITKAGQEIIDDNLEEATEIVEQFKLRLGPDNYEKLLDLLSALEAE